MALPTTAGPPEKGRKRRVAVWAEQRRGKTLSQRLRGVINGNIIYGERADRLAAHEERRTWDTLKLEIIGAIGSGVDGFETIGATGPLRRLEWVQALHARRDLGARSRFSATFLPISRSSTTLSKKEHFYAPRECLLGVWQTDNRSEHIVFMVRTAEEVILGSPRGEIESRIACYDGVPCQT